MIIGLFRHKVFILTSFKDIQPTLYDLLVIVSMLQAPIGHLLYTLLCVLERLQARFEQLLIERFTCFGHVRACLSRSHSQCITARQHTVGAKCSRS